MLEREIRQTEGRVGGSPVFQFLILMLVVVALPLALRRWHIGVFETTMLNSAASNMLAVAIGFAAMLRLTTYHGTDPARVVLPTVLVSHGLALALIVVLRASYDLVGLAVGPVLHVMVAFQLQYRSRGREVFAFATVPFGAVAKLQSVPGLVCVPLETPDLDAIDGQTSIVADFAADLPPEWEAFLARAALEGKLVYDLRELLERMTGKTHLDHLYQNDFGTLMPAKVWFDFKSKVDRVAAFALLPLLALPMALIALAIKLEDRGPVFFVQARVGHAGRLFRMVKFRSMRPAKAAGDRDAAQTRDDDDRITRVGRLIRKTRLDELPQLFNVLKGEMSMIGPRPEADVLGNWYQDEIAFYAYRHVVKPGITGWAQVNQGHVVSVDDVRDKLRYDFYYIKHYSIWLDLLIIVRTLRVMLVGYGAR